MFSLILERIDSVSRVFCIMSLEMADIIQYPLRKVGRALFHHDIRKIISELWKHYNKRNAEFGHSQI